MSNIITSSCKRQLCRHVFSGSRYFDSVKMTSDMCGIKTFQGQELQNRFIKSKSRTKKKTPAVSQPKDIASLLKPIPYTVSDAGVVGQELTGELKKEELLKILGNFYRRPEIRKFAAENGLDNQLFHKSFLSFRRFCCEIDNLPVDLHIIMSDIINGAGHIDDLLPYFIQHSKEIFPHLECMDDLQKISDLRNPAFWYSEARSIQRKIIFHAGPTNSGKTYHALQRFLVAQSGVYCGPLKLLAAEVFKKSNEVGTPCDLVTGEERRRANEDETPANHVACTVEMTSTNTPYEVAVIDEIQMIRDQQRGWAWTRSLLGLCAHEIHICGEDSAIDLVKELMLDTGDEVEVRRYERLTELKYLDEAVEKFDKIRPGDCIVCFSKNDIYYISRQLEMRGVQCAVIYGGLPPGTKLAQSEKFNNPDDPCKVMVATDAIGMGLNLCIKRIIFYSLMKPTLKDDGEKEMKVVSTSLALQIGGRAGRYGTQYQEGEVTTFRKDDLILLKDLIKKPIDNIEQGGLHPTSDQIELFAYHLPHATLCNLIDIFVLLSQLDGNRYFMCNMDDFKFLADMIEHVPLPLRVRYVLCCAPIPKTQPFICTMFLKFARQLHTGEPLTFDWLCRQIGVFGSPKTINELVHLENVFDVMDLYLWLSFRFQDMFPDYVQIQEMQRELDTVIQQGVLKITQLLKNTEKASNIGTVFEEMDDDLLDTDNQLIQDQNIEIGHGKLAEQLTKSKIISPEVLKQLQEEWEKQYKEELKQDLISNRRKNKS